MRLSSPSSLPLLARVLVHVGWNLAHAHVLCARAFVCNAGAAFTDEHDFNKYLPHANATRGP